MFDGVSSSHSFPLSFGEDECHGNLIPTQPTSLSKTHVLVLFFCFRWNFDMGYVEGKSSEETLLLADSSFEKK